MWTADFTSPIDLQPFLEEVKDPEVDPALFSYMVDSGVFTSDNEDEDSASEASVEDEASVQPEHTFLPDCHPRSIVDYAIYNTLWPTERLLLPDGTLMGDELYQDSECKPYDEDPNPDMLNLWEWAEVNYEMHWSKNPYEHEFAGRRPLSYYVNWHNNAFKTEEEDDTMSVDNAVKTEEDDNMSIDNEPNTEVHPKEVPRWN